MIDASGLTITFGHHQSTFWRDGHRIGEARKNPLTGTVVIQLADRESVFLGNAPWTHECLLEKVAGIVSEASGQAA